MKLPWDKVSDLFVDLDVLLRTELDYRIVRHGAAATPTSSRFLNFTYHMRLLLSAEELVGELACAKRTPGDDQAVKREVLENVVELSRRQFRAATLNEAERFSNDGHTKNECRKFRREGEP